MNLKLLRRSTRSSGDSGTTTSRSAEGEDKNPTSEKDNKRSSFRRRMFGRKSSKRTTVRPLPSDDDQKKQSEDILVSQSLPRSALVPIEEENIEWDSSLKPRSSSMLSGSFEESTGQLKTEKPSSARTLIEEGAEDEQKATSSDEDSGEKEKFMRTFSDDSSSEFDGSYGELFMTTSEKFSMEMDVQVLKEITKNPEPCPFSTPNSESVPKEIPDNDTENRSVPEFVQRKSSDSEDIYHEQETVTPSPPPLKHQSSNVTNSEKKSSRGSLLQKVRSYVSDRASFMLRHGHVENECAEVDVLVANTEQMAKIVQQLGQDTGEESDMSSGEVSSTKNKDIDGEDEIELSWVDQTKVAISRGVVSAQVRLTPVALRVFPKEFVQSVSDARLDMGSRRFLLLCLLIVFTAISLPRFAAYTRHHAACQAQIPFRERRWGSYWDFKMPKDRFAPLCQN